VLYEGQGLRTQWPEDLMSSAGQQLLLAFKELRSASKIAIGRTVMDQLPQFVKDMRAYFVTQIQRSLGEVKGRPTSIFRSSSQEIKTEDLQELRASLCNHLCAQLNNHRRFVELLDEHSALLLPHVKDLMGGESELQSIFSKARELFEAEGNWTRQRLVENISVDFTRTVKGSVLTPQWVRESLVPKEVGLTMQDYHNDLSLWIGREADQRDVSENILKVVLHSYLEQLLTQGISSAAPGLVRRLENDVYELATVFVSVASGMLDSDLVAACCRPLLDVLSLINMDRGRMAAFVDLELTEDFGEHAVKVWLTVMAIRDESKETTEALYGTIIYSDMMRQNGNRINKRPLVDITPFVGGLCGGRAKKKTKDWKPGN
jgi:hypothetical protein